MSEKVKSALPSAIKVKNRQKTISIEEKLLVKKADLKKINEMLT
jgi:hypothetical protein